MSSRRSSLIQDAKKDEGSAKVSVDENVQSFSEDENLENKKEVPVKFICHKWVKTSRFTGIPKYSNFRQEVQEKVLVLKDGDILVEALGWTVDPYMTIYDIPMGSVMIGEHVGSVLASKNEGFPINTLVVCSTGWETFSVVNPKTQPVLKIPFLGDLPVSLCMDTLGYPGILAYYALFYMCCVESGDTVLINNGAGAVGNVVGQIAKLKGCQVIAFCGSSEQCRWVRSLGFDHVFNYKIVRPSSALQIVAPQGVDVYFDSVGATFTMDVASCVKPGGKICMFGQAKSYNLTTLQGHHPDPYHLVLMKGRQIQYDSLTNHRDIFPQAQKQLLDWILEGKILYKEVILTGFETLPHALEILNDHSLVGKLGVLSNVPLVKEA